MITGEMMHSHANKKYLVSTFFIFLLQKKYLKRFLHPVGLFDSQIKLFSMIQLSPEQESKE